MLSADNLITANHAIATLADIALAKPEHQEKITVELLKVEYHNYDTDECRNIAIGTVILAVGPYFNELKAQEATVKFVKRQTKNTRNATRKKAGKFLKKR